MSATTWIERARPLLDLLDAQADRLEEASVLCADAIAADGLVHLFGTGHSRIPVEEMFPRYGSYPGFHPMAELSMTFHTEVIGTNGQRQAMFIERTPGLAEVILTNFDLGPPDVMFVFSHSGNNAVPVEMAAGARKRGLAVVAVTSIARHEAREDRSVAHIQDHADIVLDLCTPAGDALVEVDGFEGPVGPGSTFTAVALVNSVKVRTAELLAARGVTMPVISSSATVGDRSDGLFDEAYAEHARRVAKILHRG